MAGSEQKEVDLHRQLAKEYVKRRASEGSRLFDDYWNGEILACLDPDHRGAVLDACCGDGILLPALASVCDRVIGLDVSDDMLALARQRSLPQNCELMQGDVEALPFEVEHFDAVTFRGAFHHLERPAPCLAEVFRVLRPGGVVVMVEPNGDLWLWRLIRSLYYRSSRRFSGTHRFYRRRELCMQLSDAGVDVVAIQPVFFMAYPFAGLLDHFRIFRLVPFHAFWTRLFLRIDAVLERVPGIRNWGLALLVVGRKGSPAADG